MINMPVYVNADHFLVPLASVNQLLWLIGVNKDIKFDWQIFYCIACIKSL